MGSKLSTDTVQEGSQTDVVSAYDQSFSVSEDGKPVPIIRGSRKVAGRYVIGPFYGERKWTEPAKSSGKGGKGGGSGTEHTSATIPCLICYGPLYALDKIILNGDVVFEGPIYRASSSNPTTLTTKYGSIALYWGTDDQEPDPLLNAYEEHPAYQDCSYVVFQDFDHGQMENAYNAEFVVRAAPAQSLVTGAPAAEDIDDCLSCNAVTLAAEIVTAPYLLGVPASRVVASSFQSLADSFHGEAIAGWPTGRNAASISPLYDSQLTARELLSEISTFLDCYLRFDASGKIEVGRWKKPASVRSISFDDLDGAVEVKTDTSDAPNSYAVTFTDSEALHKESKIVVDDGAGIVADGRLKRANLDAKHVITYDQAARIGQEALRRAKYSVSVKARIRREKALNAAGGRVSPGDYLWLPVSAPDATMTQKLVRVQDVTYPADSTSSVSISGTYEPDTAGESYTVTDVPSTTDPVVIPPPPVSLARAFCLPSTEPGALPAVHVVAARPLDTAVGFDIYYDDSAAGDFPPLGKSTTFSLPLKLDVSISAVSGTIRCSFLPAGSNGEDYTRDEAFLRNWSGGETEGRNDELLLLLMAKFGGEVTTIEACSISGAPTIVDSDTFDIPVLRGRLGTTASAFASAVWSSLEVWVVVRASLAELTHSDFAEAALDSAKVLYFRPGAYTSRASYDPDAAYTERQRRVTESLSLAEYADQPNATDWTPTATVKIPAGYYQDDGVMRRLFVSAASVNRSTSNVFTPVSVTFSAKAQSSGSSAPEAYAGRIAIAEDTGSGFVDVDAPASDRSSATRALSGGSLKAVRARLYLAGAYTTLIDEVIVPVTSDGTSGTSPVVGLLTNESHTLPADSSGAVSSYTGASGAFHVYSGTALIPAASVAYSIASNPQSLTVAFGSDGLYSVTGGLDPAEELATVTLRAVYGGVTIDKVFTLAKSKSGVNAKLVVLTSDSQTFQVAKSGLVSPASITFTATGQNLSGSPTFTVESGTATLTGSGSSRSLAQAALTTDYATIRVDWDGVSDRISVVKVREGADGAGSFTIIPSTGASFVGRKLTKISGGTGWNEGGYSVEKWVNGAYASWSAGAGYTTVAGLNTDASSGSTAAEIDFAWYVDSTGNATVYESGVAIAGYGTVSASDVLAISYDGTKIVYTINGVAKRSISAASNLALSFDASLYEVGASIDRIAFGPLAGIDLTAPATPSAPTIDTQGAYNVADGGVLAWLRVNIPAMPIGAQKLVLLYRRSGGVGSDWSVACERYSGGGQFDIVDLSPGIGYYLAVQAVSRNMATALSAELGPITTTAYATTPAAVSGANLTNQGVLPRFIPTTNVFNFGTRLYYTPSSDPAFSYYEIKSVNTNSETATDYSWGSGYSSTEYKTRETSVCLYNSALPPGYTFIRQVNRSGVAGPWVYVGNANSYATIGTGNISSQSSSDLKVSGSTVAASSASSPRKILCEFPDSAVVVLTAGVSSFTYNHSLSNRGLSTAPDVCLISYASDPAEALVRYEKDSSTSTNAVFTFWHRTGGTFSAVPIRLSFAFTEYD